MPKGVYKRIGDNPLKGRTRPPFTKEWKDKLKKARATKIGILASSWKGEKAGYAAKHMWIYKIKGKANKCENPNCKYPRTNCIGIVLLAPKRFTWANKSHCYKREDGDWIQLCTSCHKYYDLGKLKLE